MEKEQRERKGSEEGRRGKQRGTGFSELKKPPNWKFLPSVQNK